MKSALLLSDSHLWGIWCYYALRRAGIAFEPLLSEEIDESFLNRYRALFVPGGWSKNKLESLGTRAILLIRTFVESGGIYIGICGGASLAGLDGLSLSPVRRKKERVPSYSGPCRVKFLREDPLFEGISQPVFFLWFPPEIEPLEEEVKVLAIFEEAHPEAYTSDLCLGDYYKDLPLLEKVYGISLNPEKMKDKPLLFESSFGKGRVFLSLIHFDTPCCEAGLKVLQNLAQVYELPKANSRTKTKVSQAETVQAPLRRAIQSMKERVDTLLEFGMRNFLFHRRYPFFLQWKRGIRGLELLNLIYIFEELNTLMNSGSVSPDTVQRVAEILSEIDADLERVLEVLKKGYILKRMNLEDPDLTWEEALVFGENLKSYGGLYRRLINRLERALCLLWREEIC